jgi:YD repeat-containing protein
MSITGSVAVRAPPPIFLNGTTYMADNPHLSADQPQVMALTDAPQRDSLSDYRNGSTLQPTDAQKLPQAHDSLPSMELSAHLEHDDKGRLTSVQYPDGSTMQCRYGAVGELTDVSTKDGGWWVRQPDNTFELYDKNRRDTGNKMESIMVDDQNGAVEYFSHLQPLPGKVTRCSDIAFANGATASMDLNPSGTKSERITFPSGETETIHYDNKGQTDQVSYGPRNSQLAGVSWVKNGDMWKQYDDSGDVTGAIMPKGSWISTGAAINGNDISWVHYPDGSADTTLINGDTVHRDASDNITQITDLKGQTEKFEYQPDGQVCSMTNKNGVTWTSVDGEWKQLDKKGKDTGAPISGFKSVAVAEDGDMKFLPTYL